MEEDLEDEGEDETLPEDSAPIDIPLDFQVQLRREWTGAVSMIACVVVLQMAGGCYVSKR